MAKRTYPRFTSPAGIAVYPRIKTPSTNFDPDGVFECKLANEEADVAEYVAKLTEILNTLREAELKGISDAARRKKVSRYAIAPVAEPEVDEEGDETGRVLIKYKLKHIVRPKDKSPWTQSPAVFDAAGTQMKRVPNVGGGSLLAIGGTVSFWVNDASKTVGISLRMEGVQILELVEFGTKDAAGFGFAAQEGFAASDAGFGGDMDDDDPDDADDEAGEDEDDF